MAHQTSSNMNFSTIIKAVCCTAIIGFSHLVPANGAAIRGADDSRVPTRAPSIKVGEDRRNSWRNTPISTNSVPLTKLFS